MRFDDLLMQYITAKLAEETGKKIRDVTHFDIAGDIFCDPLTPRGEYTLRLMVGYRLEDEPSMQNLWLRNDEAREFLQGLFAWEDAGETE